MKTKEYPMTLKQIDDIAENEAKGFVEWMGAMSYEYYGPDRWASEFDEHRKVRSTNFLYKRFKNGGLRYQSSMN